LQADPGTENSDMGAIQCTLRHDATDCFSGVSSFRVVRSVFNQVSSLQLNRIIVCESIRNNWIPFIHTLSYDLTHLLTV